MLGALPVSLGAVRPAYGSDWIEWPVGDGGNGHFYRLTTPGTWDETEAEAVGAGGHLVTINDASEQAWINVTFPRPTSEDDTFWIGLYQLPGSTEPGGGWVWVSGETPAYTNWHSAEPNDGNASVDENRCEIHHFAPSSGQGLWNDRIESAIRPGIIERDSPPIPALSEYGIVVMALVALVVGTIAFQKRGCQRAET